ncbi:MAG: TraR/DksA family transcriptional regulator [Brachybacterium paraconglomeratum]|nr:TraR/DksA family transcriptional regulator [Brachybacterium paraconglomeratum]
MAKSAKNSTASSDVHETLSVREDEAPWSAEELAEVRAELEADATRLSAEVHEAEHDLVELMRSYGDGAGDDQADAGAATWEREHELSLTNNAKGLLMQTLHALERMDNGTYGDCESCGRPIGKMRLQAFPRATLCMTCKQKQERR